MPHYSQHEAPAAATYAIQEHRGNDTKTLLARMEELEARAKATKARFDGIEERLSLMDGQPATGAKAGGPKKRGLHKSLLDEDKPVKKPSRSERFKEGDAESLKHASYRAHKRYWENVRLAFCVSVWVVIFSLPTYSALVYEWMFGKAGTTDSEGKAYCGPADLGVTENGTNCGWLPYAYYGYWPNVVQMIVFTIYLTTGNTMQLAAQGVFGTAAACVLYYWVLQLYPEGASDKNYCEPVAWLYFIGGTFLFLINTGPENAIKFGLSYHVTFAMKFMNPDVDPQTRHGYLSTGYGDAHYDSETSVVMMTSIMGAFLAIIGTLIPVPLLNITRIDDDAIALQVEMKKIWSESIAYFCGSKQTSKHYSIESRIDGLGPMVARIKGNLSITWWETFDIGHFGCARMLFVAYANLVEHMDDVCFSLKTAIHSEDFKGNHTAFCTAMESVMTDLMEQASALMLLCAQACMDGDISKEEEKQLAASRAKVLKAQKALLDRYNHLSQSDSGKFPYVSQDLANENVFIFALSAWARYVSDFADQVDDIYRNMTEGHGCCHAFLMTFKGLFHEVIKMYAPSGMTRDHLIFAVRNMISITLCFVLGLFDLGPLFPERSATMAATCAILISKFTGSAFHQNLQRLLGLALGKVLPLLVMAAIGALSDTSHPIADKLGVGDYVPAFFSIIHGFAILIYMFVFIYMGMTSLQWASVGMIIAGFGCYGLLQTPLHMGKDPKPFADMYKEIGQTTFAIIIQLFVDASFMMPSPRDLALGHINSIRKEYVEAFQSFFEGNLTNMQTEAIDMSKSYTAANAMAPECDPKLVVVPGKRTNFKFALYTETLMLLKVIRSDFKMLLVAMKDWKPAPNPKDGDDKDFVRKRIHEDKEESSLLATMGGLKAMSPIKHKVIDHMKTTLTLWSQVMAHESEAVVDTPALQTLVQDYEPGDAVLNVDDLAREINGSHAIKSEAQKAAYEASNMNEITSDRRVRLTVAVRALERSAEHLSMIDALILKENIF